ncbi:MAG TPA: TonB-dependent receptor, partial [Rhizomicrobium sp.]
MNRRNSCFISALLAGTACIVPTFAAAADSIETVVVTASRRAQSVQDVPYNISAYSGKDLAASGAINMSTLTQAIPGLVTAGQTSGNNSNFVMRGLNANKTTDGGGQTFGTVPPVATYYGETPIFFPLRLTDIERVEVLRGPQGTLYGSGSLAGTIRFIPNRPDYESFAFGGTVSLSGTDNAGAPNESLEGMVNLPLVEGRLALRVVVALDNNAGFIDGNGLVQLDAAGVPVPRVAGNLASGFVVLPRQHGINATDAEQTRVELRGQVTDWLEAEVNYTHQRNHSDNPQATNPTFAGGMIDNSAKNFPGSLFPNVFGAAGGHVWPDGGAVFPANTRYDQSAYLNQPSDRSTDVLDLDVAADLGFASLTSSTSYYNVASHAILDESGLDEVSNGAASGNFAYAYSFYPRLMQRDRMTTGNNGTVEEVRLVSNWDEPIDYVVGGYYADQSQRRTNFDLVPGLSAFDTTVLPGIGGPFGHNNATMPDVIYTLNQRTQFSDRALFGELTWHVTPALQVTGGARTFWQTVGTQFAQTLPYCGKPCSTNPADPLGGASADSSTSTQGTIYKANASYKLGEDLMAYATYAEGFRHGGANGISLVGIYASLPSYLTYKPDTSANYEAGLKGTVFGQTFTAAAFLIHWDNFQFDGSTPSAFPIVING